MAKDQSIPDSERRSRTVSRGIRARMGGFQANVEVDGTRYYRTFPRGTPLGDMAGWRRSMRKDLHREAFRLQKAREAFREPLPQVSELPKVDGCGWYVYVIQCAEFVKVGRAINPFHRLNRLQTAHPQTLRLVAVIPCVASIAVEAAVHERFALRRVRGEWFELDTSLLSFIDAVTAGRVNEATVMAARFF